MSRITRQELESYHWGAAVLLRSLIEAGDFKQFISPYTSNDVMKLFSQC